jgi:hypothetical protein
MYPNIPYPPTQFSSSYATLLDILHGPTAFMSYNPCWVVLWWLSDRLYRVISNKFPFSETLISPWQYQEIILFSWYPIPEPTDLEKSSKGKEPGEKKNPEKRKRSILRGCFEIPRTGGSLEGSILGEFICVLIKEPLLS